MHKILFICHGNIWTKCLKTRRRASLLDFEIEFDANSTPVLKNRAIFADEEIVSKMDTEVKVYA